jgi:hypothetical protein
MKYPEQVIQTRTEAAELEYEITRAWRVLNDAGVRLMKLDGKVVVGIWSDLDGPEIRAALGILGSGDLEVCYLDGFNVPDRFKLRRVAGEPVPLNVLAEMERHLESPWKIGDKLLEEVKWTPEGIPLKKWYAAQLDRIFKTGPDVSGGG